MDELRGKREEIDAQLMGSDRQIKTLEAEIDGLNDQISRLHPLDPETKRLKVHFDNNLFSNYTTVQHSHST